MRLGTARFRPLAFVVYAAAGLSLACGGAAAPEDEATAPVLVPGTPPPFESGPDPLAAGRTPERTAEPSHEPVLVDLSWLAASIDAPGVGALAEPAPDAALQQVIEAAVAGRTGTYSVLVHNLADGRYAAVNPGHVHYAASLFKLGVMYEAFRQRDAGELDLSKELVLTEEYAQYDLGTLALLGLKVGDRVRVGDAVRAMIVLSDTPTALLVQNEIGGRRGDETLAALGLKNTRFFKTELPTTAEDIALLLRVIVSGEGVSGESRAEMISLMLQETYVEGIVAGVPEGTAVAHKTGSFGNATHDAAVVWGPAGPYVLVVLTDQPANWPAVAEISAAVWNYFAGAAAGANP